MGIIWVMLLNTLATVADIDLIGSIIYGFNMGDVLHSLATVADIDLIGSTIYGSNMGDMLLQLLILTFSSIIYNMVILT